MSEDSENEKDSKDTENQISLNTKQVAIGSFTIGILIGIILTGAAFLTTGGLETQNSEDPEELSLNVKSYDAGLGTESDNFEWEGGYVDLEDRPHLGDSDAETTIVSYEDFTCVFCAQHNTETFPELLENEIEDGEVQYFYKHWPRTPEGQELAEFSSCVLKQDEEKFWQAKEHLYENFRDLERGNQDELKEDIIRGLEIDEEELETCRDEKAESFVQEDHQEGLGFDYTFEGPDGQERDFVSGTPGFVVYDHESEEAEVIPGALPYSEFQNTMD